MRLLCAQRQWGSSLSTLCAHANACACLCRSIRTRRFQTLSTQDFVLFLVVGVLAGLFWLRRAQHSTVAAASDTLG